MKKALVCLFVLLLFFSCGFAFSLNTPSKVPEGSSWSFSIFYDTIDFDQSVISVDGVKVATLYAFYQEATKVVVDETRVLNYSFTKSRLTLTLPSLELGRHVVSVENKRFGGLVGEESAEFVVFTPLEDSYRQEVERDLNSLGSKIEGLEEGLSHQSSELSRRIGDLEESLNSLSSRLGKSDERLLSIKEELEELKALVESYKRSLERVDAEITDVKMDLNSFKERKTEPLISGLASFISANALYAIALLLVIIIIAIILLALKKRFEEGPLFAEGPGLRERAEEAEGEGEEEAEPEEEPFQGKWAYRGEEEALAQKTPAGKEKISAKKLLWKGK